ncbi:phage portal protein [Phyllobacteriaceae bacterium JZ32]
MGFLAALRKAITPRSHTLSPVDNRGSWFPVYEPYAGAWQKNIQWDRETALSYHAVYACVTLIASDISKLRVKLVQMQESGVWQEVKNPAYDPVLRKPNKMQTRNQFWENWMISKLLRGNTYVLKRRDNRKVVKELYVLDPSRVTPLVTEDGDIYYQLDADNITGIEQGITVPASEIIHDRFNCLFHPLVGIPPIYASGIAATQGLRIQNNSLTFFGNKSQPGGILTAPGSISEETATRLKQYFEANFTGDKAGRVAVVGDGLTYTPLAVSAQEAQLIEQLRWTAEVVCSTFHVPPYKIGVGTMPNYNNIQSLNVEYYSQCLQTLLEAAETCLDEGLNMPVGTGTEFDIDGLLRMDSVTQMEMLDKSKGILSPNEQRKKLDLPPKAGGDSPMLQQQNFSLEALAKRDAQTDPFAKGAPALAAPVAGGKTAVEGPKAITAIHAKCKFATHYGKAAQ